MSTENTLHLPLSAGASATTRLVTASTCGSCAPDRANISPWKYSLRDSALRSISRYCSGEM